MLRALTSGLSGLKSHQTKMDVIGNNIANVNTAGFKASRVSFKDTFYQTLTGSTDANDVSGGRNPSQIGYGSNVATIDVLHTRGNYSPTGRVMDAFISGDGYFIARDGNGKERYTRTGIFNFDGSGNLVDGNQQFICGYPLDRYKADVAGKSALISSDPTNVATTSIRFGETAGAYFNGYRIKYVAGAAGSPISALTDNASKVITITAPENTTPSAADVQQALRQMKTTDPDNDFPAYVKGALDEITVDAGYVAHTLGALGSADQFSGVAVEGSNAHKTGDVIFDITPAIAAKLSFGGTPVDFGIGNGGLLNGYKIEMKVQEAGGTPAVTVPEATLDAGNKVIKITLPAGAVDVTEANLQLALRGIKPSTGDLPAGFNPALIKVGAADPPTGTVAVPATGITSTKISGGVDQIVTTRLDKENGVQQIQVPGQMIDTDGNGVYDVETGGVMNLVGIQIGSDGIISAEAPNGTIIQVGQILLASIPNPQALTMEGNSYLTAMSNTGDIMYGVPGTEGTGPLVSGGVEGSNVDLANEFADMITTQRGFQANSRIFTVGDEMLQELINLKR